MAHNWNKRKQSSNNAPAAKRPRFEQPKYNISTTPTSKAFPNDEINASRFVRAHEEEINALERGIRAAKKGLARRAFQDVPRDMRRRTASHNPIRVPERLRARARKEAKEDNTPIAKGKSGSGIGKGSKMWLRKEGITKAKLRREMRDKKAGMGDKTKGSSGAEEKKDMKMNELVSEVPSNGSNVRNTKRKKQAHLATPATPAAKFRKRQMHKTWLPTHLFHTKRAHLTAPKDPLWRFAIPLSPTMKSYRLTHRAASLRGAVAWDMSYISTIGLEGAESSVVGLLKMLHFGRGAEDELWEDRGKGKKWRNGLRIWESWIYEREGNSPKKIAPITVIWSVGEEAESGKRKAFIRVHPSAFLPLWNEILKVSKVQKPAVSVEDLRFEIGSIQIVGPAATECLCSALSPTTICHAESPDTPQSIWPTLAPVTNLQVLPSSALLAFSVTDPRLRYPPRPTPISLDGTSQSQLTQILAYWPIDRTQTAPAIFNRNARLAAGRTLPSQKSINRRKAAASPGEYPDARSTDPHIPVLAYISRESNSWTILLPWKCVLPVWRSIMFYPVSTGGNPKFGGLTELRQVYFEKSTPWFPGDFPGTDAGWAWELQQRVDREREWMKRPKRKRIEWTTIDLGSGKKGEVGNPWACEWDRLLPKSSLCNEADKESDSTRLPFRHLPSSEASNLISHPSSSALSDYRTIPHLFTAKIIMVQRGVPTNCARIYRLPVNNPELQNKWLSLLLSSKAVPGPKRSTGKYSNANSRSQPNHLRRRALAANLLAPKEQDEDHVKAGHKDYPVVPDEEDLIGFVTTGNYNLAEGIPTAVANLALHKVLEVIDVEAKARGRSEERHVCIVREAGRTLGRLARWEVV